MKHPSEEDLILAYYGEAEADPGVVEHLASCSACRSDYDALRATLDLARSVPAPEPRPEFEADLWRRIRPRLEPAMLRPRRSWPSAARLAEIGGIAALVLVAFLVGRYLPRTPEQTASAPTITNGDEVRRRILVSDVGEHLERTERLLVEFANASDALDVGAERGAIQELLAANRLYRQAAAAGGEAALAVVLEEVERTLVEMAHTPAHLSGAGLEAMQRRVEEGGVLFKVRVVYTQLLQREAAAARERAKRMS